MLNIFTKSKPWMAISLFVATSMFGQPIAADSCRPRAPEPKPVCPPKPCPPKPCCEPVPQIQLIPAYNAPARIDVRGCWDLYIGASFIYWEAMQDNMDFCTSVVANSTIPYDTTAGNNYKTTASLVDHDFTYKPGFKVLAGMNFDHDNWEGFAEYTWFYSKTKTSASRIPRPENLLAGVIFSSGLYPTKGDPTLSNGTGVNGGATGSVFTSGKQEWKLKFQALNTALARTYYVGKQLTFRSIFGPRFAWFTQRKEIEFSNPVGAPLGLAGELNLHQNFSSWGAGLMAGLDTSWILGEGFRVIGNGSFDLLYTRVQTNNFKQQWIPNGNPPLTHAYPQSRPDFVMPHAALEFGFGWGSYFDCNNWHIDLLATYGFQAFWDANLFREFHDSLQFANSTEPNGNLYMHGLTATMRLDF